MLGNYLTVAIRHLLKQRLYTLISLLGLAMGLAVFMFSRVWLNYDTNHDHMFKDRDQIWVVGSKYHPDAGEKILTSPNTYSAFAPKIEQQLQGLVDIARVQFEVQPVKAANRHWHLGIRFADPAFTRIFDFDYIVGDASALDDGNGIILTASQAKALFGHTNVMGLPITIAQTHQVHVSAVIKDVAPDSHFNASLMPNYQLTSIAPLSVLVAINPKFSSAGNWQSVSMYHNTYLKMDKGSDKAWLQQQIEELYLRHASEEAKQYVSKALIYALTDMGNAVWHSFGLPVREGMGLIGILVMVLAFVNYANIATAQSFGRSKEAGLRQAMGAGRSQLMVQFLAESLVLALLALLVGFCALELMVPILNKYTGRVMQLDHLEVLPLALSTTLLAGLLAGAWPAWVMANQRPLDCLQDLVHPGTKGARLRNLMLIVQFCVSTLILSMVLVIHGQNQKMQEAARWFLDMPLVIFKGIEHQPNDADKARLLDAVKKIDGVTAAAFSSLVPFDQLNTGADIGKTSDPADAKTMATMIAMTEDYLDVFEIPMLVADTLTDDTGSSQVMVSAMAARKLGFEQPKDAVGEIFYAKLTLESDMQGPYTIIGVTEDVNLLQLFNPTMPLVFYVNPQRYRYFTVKLADPTDQAARDAVDAAWQNVFPSYPARRGPIVEMFNTVYFIFVGLNLMLTLFAALALILALARAVWPGSIDGTTSHQRGLAYAK